MYLGTGGYAFTLHKVLKFLRYDAEHSDRTVDPIFDMEKA